jgi:4a-hydroxytetrahydrobiopterin dehydratase
MPVGAAAWLEPDVLTVYGRLLGVDGPEDLGQRLTRTAASQAVEAIGWRYLLGVLRASVAVPSLDEGLRVAAAAAAACGALADRHLWVDLRPDRVELSLQTKALAAVTDEDTALAHAVSAAVTAVGAATTPGPPQRPVQALELAIDALDIASIRPFWKAVLALTEEPGSTGSADALVDPAGQLPALWFQQMDAPRAQRNRIHLDITVTHEEAEERVRAALAAGGTLLDDSHARAFWVLADAEGNEVCVCSWMDRDERDTD